ncbi:MAG: hypothetical protein ACRD4B_07440 [Acidobacteriota bacterium]
MHFKIPLLLSAILLSVILCGLWVTGAFSLLRPNHTARVSIHTNENAEQAPLRPIGSQPDSQFSVQPFETASARSNVKQKQNTPAPHQLYKKHVAGALAGNPDSQLVLARVLDFCAGAPHSRRQVREAMDYGHEPRIIEMLNVQYEQCRELLIAVPDARGKSEQWYLAARDSGHPIIQAHRKVRSAGEKREFIKKALEGEYEEALLYGEIFFQASAFYANYEQYKDPVLAEAWFLLYCENTLDCDLADYLYNLRMKVPPYQYEEIQSTAKVLRQNVKSHNIEALGFSSGD